MALSKKMVCLVPLLLGSVPRSITLILTHTHTFCFPLLHSVSLSEIQVTLTEKEDGTEVI